MNGASRSLLKPLPLGTSYPDTSSDGGRHLPKAIIDFETRSRCDLRAHGAWRYAKDPSTEVLCMGYEIDDNPAKLWKGGDDFPADLGDHIARGGLIEAHKYFFEKCIWRHIMQPQFYWPQISPDVWRCTAALAAYHNLPRSLENAGAALGLAVRKDQEGHRLMLKMCKPRKPTKNNSAIWHEDPEDLKKLYEYCKQDVRAERALADALGELPPRELALWQFTERLNWRGVKLDLDFAARAVEMFEVVEIDGRSRASQITNGSVTTLGQTARIIDWCGTQGVELQNLQRPTVAALLGTEIPGSVRELLEIRKKLSKAASISKYKAMLARADLEDQRLRDHVRFSGAGPGRWAGQGVQTQNLIRDVNLEKAKQFIEVVKAVIQPKNARLLYEDPATELSKAIRPTFQAGEGRRFVCADYSAIEARVLAWLTNDPNLSIFRANGDVYIEMASKIYERPITKEDKLERALGKEAELACGYQLWWRRLLTRCWQKDVKIDPGLALQTVKLYRKSHPKITKFWRDIEQAFLECVLYKKPTRLGLLRFERDAKNAYMIFPSGRRIAYNDVSVKTKVRKATSVEKLASELRQLGATPKVIEDACAQQLSENKNAGTQKKQVICYYREDSTTHRWTETATYGGKVTENACQGIAGDIISEASLRLEKDPERFGYTVLTVHDELANEQTEGREDLQGMIEEMCKLSSWAQGLPLAAEGWVGKRYRK